MAGVKHSLSVDLNGLRFPLPVLAASGCFGTGREVGGLVDPHKLGGVVTRSLTLAPTKGSPTPRVTETPSGLVSSIGLQNPGVEDFVLEDLPRLAKSGLPVIASIAGKSLEEYVRMASFLQDRAGIVALEVYLSAPDEERGGGEPFASRLDRVIEIVGAVSRISRAPVFAKLPLLTDLVETAQACVRAGAHGLTLIDALPAMAIDVERLRPKLAAGVGWLSGPAIRPVAVAAVYRVARELPDVPIFGVGGVATAEDAIEFLLAGAWAVQVGTALLVDPHSPAEISAGILRYLRGKGLASPADLRGRVRLRPQEGSP